LKSLEGLLFWSSTPTGLLFLYINLQLIFFYFFFMRQN
jgi:hypothetical protein